jgi:hypothetical protein
MLATQPAQPEPTKHIQLPPIKPSTHRVIVVPFSRIVVDPKVQRMHSEQSLQSLIPWDWAKCETPSVVKRKNNDLVVVEGQRRALVLKLHGYEGTWDVRLIIGAAGIAAEAKLAREISSSRKSLAALEKWQLDTLSGNPHNIKTNLVMADHNLHFGQKAATFTIATVSTVHRIVHRFDNPEHGADHYDDVLDTIERAWPFETIDAEGGKRWDSLILNFLSQLLIRNPDIDRERLAKNLRSRDAGTWIAQAKAKRGDATRPLDFIAYEVLRAYNNKLSQSRKARWANAR